MLVQNIFKEKILKFTFLYNIPFFKLILHVQTNNIFCFWDVYPFFDTLSVKSSPKKGCIAF